MWHNTERTFDVHDRWTSRNAAVENRHPTVGNSRPAVDNRPERVDTPPHHILGCNYSTNHYMLWFGLD